MTRAFLVPPFKSALHIPTPLSRQMRPQRRSRPDGNRSRQATSPAQGPRRAPTQDPPCAASNAAGIIELLAAESECRHNSKHTQQCCYQAHGEPDPGARGYVSYGTASNDLRSVFQVLIDGSGENFDCSMKGSQMVLQLGPVAAEMQIRRR